MRYCGLMTHLQQAIIGTYGIIAAGLFGVAVYAVHHKMAYGRMWLLNLFSSFVWGDMLVFAPFWALSSAVSIYFQSWFLFEIIFLTTWFIRAMGETIYWFLQQFSTVVRERPEDMFLYRFVKSNAVWFIMQIWWQCIGAVALTLLIFVVLGHLS